MTSRILLISGERRLSERVKDALGGEITLMCVDPTAPHAADAMPKFQPDAVLLDSDTRTGALSIFERVGKAKKLFPDQPIIVIGNEMSAQLVLGSMRAGADDFIDRDASPSEFRSILLSRLASAAPRPDSNGGAAFIGILSAMAAEEDEAFALNLGCILAGRNQGNGVLLLDLSLPFSSAPIALGIEAKFSLHDALRDLTRLDRALLDSALVRCPQSGLLILPLAIDSAASDISLDVNDLRTLIELLRSMFDAVIVYYGPFSRHEQLVDVAHPGSHLFVCCNQRISSIKAAGQLIDGVNEKGKARNEIAIAVHEFAPEIAPDAHAIKSILRIGRMLRLGISWAKLTGTFNLGEPLAFNEACPYTRSITEYLESMGILEATDKHEKPSLARFMFGRHR